MSPANIFSGQEVVAQPPPSRVFKANEPNVNSPFSQAPTAAPVTNRDAANRQSVDSPFAQNPATTYVPAQAATAQKAAFRVQQTPGGTQSFNLFGDNGYSK